MYEITPDYVNMLTSPTDGFLCELRLGSLTSLDPFLGEKHNSFLNQAGGG